MGLLDIFYSEVNRFRDKLNSKKERKKILKEALKKTLKKFKFLWEDQLIDGTYSIPETKELLNEFSENFIVLAVECDEGLDDNKIVENLRSVSKKFKQMSRFVPTGGFRDSISREMGQALNQISEINQRLEK